MMNRIIIMTIVYLFEMLISFCFFSRIYKKKQKSYSASLLIGILLFLAADIIFLIFQNEIINTSIFFVINVAYALLCFDISLKNAFIQSIILDALMIATEYMTIFFLSIIYDVSTNQHHEDLNLLIIYATTTKLVYFVVAQIVAEIILKIGHQNNKVKHFLPLFIFPVLTIITNTMFLLLSFKTEMSIVYRITASVICILSIFASVFVFIYYQMLANKEEKINELESEKRLFNLNTAYMEILQHQNNELQMVFHDTKNHYTALSGFDNIEDVRAYISKIYPTIEKKNIIKISSNKMLDLIISKYIITCQNSNINFDYEVKTANLDYIDDAELSMILNNVLDNAVEAALGSREKQIEFSLRHINHMDLLSVVNSCDNPPKHKNHQLLTTKSNTGSHGFGTKIIKKYVKKNNGKYEWFYDDIECKFHLTILFQRKDKGSGTN